MKKSEREIYRILFNEIDTTLCALCKFQECDGGISPCDCGEPYCAHPLKERFSNYDDGIYPGDDCWGFRHSFPLDFCTDVVGIVLQKGWDDWVVWQQDDVWHIYGTQFIPYKRQEVPGVSHGN